MRFFRTTWIPDETFFQTIVRHLVPREEIKSRTLTFLMFTDYGMPVTFYNDHYDMLLAQDGLFARKISPEAKALKERLGALYVSDREDFQVSNEGRSLFKFLTGRGRIGRRFATRFWETETSLGRERELLIVACKKWHVAKRLTAAIRVHTDVPAIDYLFNEDATDMPNLGGIQSTLGKRTRHRRALMRMLFDNYATNKLVICLDTASIDLMQDFFSDRSNTKLLEIECTFSDAYLSGHARRVGLAGDQTSDDALARLLPTIRHDVIFESDRIRDSNFASTFRIREVASETENARAIAQFLGVTDEIADTLAATPHLFVD